MFNFSNYWYNYLMGIESKRTRIYLYFVFYELFFMAFQKSLRKVRYSFNNSLINFHSLYIIT